MNLLTIVFISLIGLITAQTSSNVTTFSWDFRDGSNNGWFPFLSNYTTQSISDNPFIASFARLPELEEGSDPSLNSTPTEFNTGFNLDHTNFDGGSSMGLVRRLFGLPPNTIFNLEFSVLYATNVGTDCNTTALGNPGSDVMIKVGALREEPVLGLDSDNMWRWINFDEGPFGEDGRDSMVAGTMGSSVVDNCSPQSTEFFLESLTVSSENSSSTFNFTSNENGEMWLVVDTQSIFRGNTDIWWISIDLRMDAIGTIGGGNGTNCPTCPTCPSCPPVNPCVCPRNPVINVYLNGTTLQVINTTTTSD